MKRNFKNPPYIATSSSQKHLLHYRKPKTCPTGFEGRYTVVQGDTMFFIAKRFGVSLDALIAANPHITNPNVIYPGDVLCVPKANGRVPKTCPEGFQGRYTVVQGDTMFFIAKRFGVSLDALIAANPHITDPNVIYPGDVLCVPKANGRVPKTCPEGFQGRYTVVQGDTMFFIAQRFGVSLDALIAANPHITDPNVIYPGDVLCVPKATGRIPETCPEGFQGRYTVVQGDTMFFIAQRFGVSLDALIAANPHITDPNVIYPGDVLCVPGVALNREPETCPEGFQGRYTVVQGDTIYIIAKRYGINFEDLIAANPHITNPNFIYPGDILCVPPEDFTSTEE